MSSILVIIPTYNERRNIETLIRQLKSVSISLDVLVVDDNSPDGTAFVVKKLQTQLSHVYLILRNEKRGLGSAYNEGFQYALKKGYDAVIQMDADLSHDPADIVQMTVLLNEYDVVIGSRYIQGGGIDNWSLLRRTLSKWANTIARVVLCLPIRDVTSGFKGIKTTVLRGVDSKTVTSQGYFFQIELLMYMLEQTILMIEMPIIFRGRRHERSKMDLKIILEAIVKIVLYGILKKGCFYKEKRKR